jgi:hypothetical protein
MLRDDWNTVAFPEFAMRLSLILISLGLSACNRGGPPDPHHARKTEVTINLRPLGINGSETFEEVRAKALPQAVLDQMEGIADAGEPFNGTDDVDSGKPMTSLIVAAVSQHYCALSYWQGGIALTFNTKVFDLSDGHAGLIWHSQGQGGFYL